MDNIILYLLTIIQEQYKQICCPRNLLTYTVYLQNRGWNKSTTHTLVARLRGKGLIEPTERYGVARYVPLITEDEYILAEGKAVIEKFGNAKTLALAMVRNGHLTNADIEELREYFKMGGDGK